MGPVAELEQSGHTHRDVNGGLRPAVFGAMDGLVSNFALIAGMDGGTSSGSKFIVLAGLAGLAAGAFSMAAGGYTSVASQRELADKVARQFHKDPDQALEEHVREDLGLDPNAPPSPVTAASSSFICFAIG